MSNHKMTIGQLAKEAGVGVETIRYYQSRGLIPIPQPTGSYRYYSQDVVERLRFIKRAQELGFSLDEIQGLLSLSANPDKASIRQVAIERLAQIEEKLADLQRMQQALSGLIDACCHAKQEESCPIVAALSGK